MIRLGKVASSECPVACTQLRTGTMRRGTVWLLYDHGCWGERFPISLFPFPFFSSVDSFGGDVESGERGIARQQCLFGLVGEVVGVTKDGEIRLLAGFE